MTLAIVTATLDLARARACMESWEQYVGGPFKLYIVVQGTTARELWIPARYIMVPEIQGVVPAFAIGVQQALEDGAEVIACLHDDLLIEEDGWDQQVLDAFTHYPQIGLVGFGGGCGLGRDDLYHTPYDPMQLARQDFVSNMRDAEAHGRRLLTPRRVACLDGFSLIGSAAFWTGRHSSSLNYFQYMQALGVTHHCYDSAAGAWAKRFGWEVWMLPIACHHFGGRTAVGDARYAEWARQQHPGGDGAFWEIAHRVCYAEFRDVLPIRTEEP